MKKMWLVVPLLAAVILTILWAQGPNTVPDPVAKVLRQSCARLGCHRGGSPAKGLNLEPDKAVAASINVPSRQVPSLKIIDPQDSKKSYLLMKVRGDADIVGRKMPRNRAELTAEEIQALKDWIDGLAAR